MKERTGSDTKIQVRAGESDHGGDGLSIRRWWQLATPSRRGADGDGNGDVEGQTPAGF